MPPNPATEIEGASTTSVASELEEWHGFCAEEPVAPSPERLIGSDFLASPNDETDDHHIFKRKNNNNTRSVGKRKPIKKSQKELLVGEPSRKVKRKGKHEPRLRLHKRAQQTRNHNCLAEDDENSLITNWNANTSVANLDVFVRDAFATRLNKGWDEFVSGVYLDDKAKQIDHGFSERNDKSNYSGYRRNDSLVRAHMRKVMKLPQTIKTRYGSTQTKIPWSKLGLWLHMNKKKFINWDKTLPFAKVKIEELVAVDLKKMLLIDVVDWTKNEIKYETSNVPLVLDTAGRVLVKVGDLPQLYPDSMVDTVERSSGTGLGYSQLPHTIPELVSSSSSAASSTTLSQPKRKHQIRSFK